MFRRTMRSVGSVLPSDKEMRLWNQRLRDDLGCPRSGWRALKRIPRATCHSVIPVTGLARCPIRLAASRQADREVRPETGARGARATEGSAESGDGRAFSHPIAEMQQSRPGLQGGPRLAFQQPKGLEDVVGPVNRELDLASKFDDRPDQLAQSGRFMTRYEVVAVDRVRRSWALEIDELLTDAPSGCVGTERLIAGNLRCPSAWWRWQHHRRFSVAKALPNGNR